MMTVFLSLFVFLLVLIGIRGVLMLGFHRLDRSLMLVLVEGITSPFRWAMRERSSTSWTKLVLAHVEWVSSISWMD
ncbi:hypothetical protein YC2023_099195 [Brassica napus]